MILVANNPYDSPLLHTQLLGLYAKQTHYSGLILICNGGPASSAIPDDRDSFTTEIKSFQVSRFGILNYTYLLFLLTGYVLQGKTNHFHLRGFVVAIMFYTATFMGLAKRKYIYDPRGAFLIEKNEQGSPIRLFNLPLKIFETNLIRGSVKTIVTSKKFQSLFEEEYGLHEKYAVIYNNSAIPVALHKNLTYPDEINVVYMGTINYWHDIDEIFRVFDSFQSSSFGLRIKFHFATHQRFHNRVKEKLTTSTLETINLSFVPHSELATYLEKMQVGVSVVKPTRSSSIASPIKISDYISAGLVIVANNGIGDFDTHFQDHNSALLYEYGQTIDIEPLLKVNANNNQTLLDRLSTKTAAKRLGNILDSIEC